MQQSFINSEIIHILRTQNSIRRISYGVTGFNCLFSFTWIRSYMFGSHSQYESVLVDDKKKFNKLTHGNNQKLSTNR